MKSGLLLILTSVLFVQGCARSPESIRARQNELARVLNSYLKLAVETEDFQENAGWFQPANRQALADFTAKYPGTEESFQAEIWLALGLPPHEKFITAERLRAIGQAASQPGTVKFAKLERAWTLYQENSNDHADFIKQADEILSHIEEYQADKQLRHYLTLMRYPISDLEPDLRLSIVYEEAYGGHLDTALELVKDLKNRFPHWQNRSVDAEIKMIELYKSGSWPPSTFQSSAIQPKSP